jgi:hypothetical protein
MQDDLISKEALLRCVEDAGKVWTDKQNDAPLVPEDYDKLIRQLEIAGPKLPPVYRKDVFDRFIKKLEEGGPKEGAERLRKVLEEEDPKREGVAGGLLDLAGAVLHNACEAIKEPTYAFQEVVCDLYDGFLSEEDRVGVKRPDLQQIPALVKWGKPGESPYTWNIRADTGPARTFDVATTIVSLPPAHMRIGLFGWAMLPHETCGHNIISADNGLENELTNVVVDAVKKANFQQDLERYWNQQRIVEAAADVLGILNMGPAAAVGLIGYLRGFNKNLKLDNHCYEDDPHPADILRGYLAAETTRLLTFDGAARWGTALFAEVEKDFGEMSLGGRQVGKDEAMRSAQIVAETLVHAKWPALEDHALSEIQNWKNEDQQIADSIGKDLVNPGSPTSYVYSREYYAAHAVAGAVTQAVAGKACVKTIFDGMVKVLKQMHDRNPQWGSQSVVRRVEFARHQVISQRRLRERFKDSKGSQ